MFHYDSTKEANLGAHHNRVQSESERKKAVNETIEKIVGKYKGETKDETEIEQHHFVIINNHGQVRKFHC